MESAKAYRLVERLNLFTLRCQLCVMSTEFPVLPALGHGLQFLRFYDPFLRVDCDRYLEAKSRGFGGWGIV